MAEETITRNDVIAFGRNLNMTPQVGATMLTSCVDSDLNFTEPGGYYTDEFIGTTSLTPIIDRFGDSPSKSLSRDRRGGYFYPYEDGNFLGANLDKARQLIDPANPTVEAMRIAVQRGREDFIYNMGLGAVRQGQTLENSVAFPAGNIIASNVGENTNLCPGKIRRASKMLGNGEVIGSRYWLGFESDKENLLSNTVVTSSDYNTVKALVNGEINTWLGFTFIWFSDNRAQLNGSGERENMVWVKNSLAYRGRPIVGGENAHIVQRADKKMEWYAYLSIEHAGHRRFDQGVLRVDCA